MMVFRMGMERTKWIVAATAACFGALLAASPAGAAIAQEDVNYDLGSPPAPSPADENFLDVYRPDGSLATDTRPVVVYVHGGAWRAGDKANQINRKVNLFTDAGYVFVSVNYRLSTNPIDTSFPSDRVRFPDHPDDVGEAIGWIDRNIAAYGGDPTRLLLIGHSAGAHISALVSTDPSYLDAYEVEPWQVIGTVALDGDAYDVADRIAEVPSPQDDYLLSAFGTAAENAAEGSWAAGSPLLWAGPRDPEHLIVTQAALPGRAEDADALALALGQDPAASVIRAPCNHEGINDGVGEPGDPCGETAAIVAFFARMVDGSDEPVAKIKQHPGKRVKPRRGKSKAKVKFTFASSLEGTKFECRLDGKQFRSCRSPYKDKLRRGRYTFKVRPQAPSGRPGEAESFSFRVARAR